jgi:hypothetical protein
MTQISAFLLSFIASFGSWLSTPQASSLFPPMLGFGGAVAGALIGARGQKKATQQAIESEYRKIQRQVSEQSIARLRARKEDIIADKVLQLLISSDPELSTKPDYPSILKAIHSIQLFLDLSLARDKDLNQGIQELALTVRDLLAPSQDEAFLEHLASLKERGLDVEAMEAQMERDDEISKILLHCQARLIEATQKFLNASLSGENLHSLQRSTNEEIA